MFNKSTDDKYIQNNFVKVILKKNCYFFIYTLLQSNFSTVKTVFKNNQ